MRVLVACECSGIVRDAFAARGHFAVSCDLKPSETGGRHYTGDVFELIPLGFDLMIAHPPCTFLCSSGMHWTTRGLRPKESTEDALLFVDRLMGCGIPRIAIENPVGVISTRIRKPDQIIQPWQFGEDASKATCLWLQGLPPLIHTEYVPPRIVNGRKRWANQTDSGQNRLGPGNQRSADRSRTYRGIAEAMASQWT